MHEPHPNPSPFGAETKPATGALLRLAEVKDIGAMFHVRSHTRDNAISAARLAELGITAASIQQQMLTANYRAWVWEEQGAVLAFCAADASTAEVLVLAVLAGQEGRGIGRALLQQALQYLQAQSSQTPWLMAGRDARLRSHGFYRQLEWQASGRVDEHGDEELLYAEPSTPTQKQDSRMSAEQQLIKLGLALSPASAPAGNYVSAVRSGQLLFLSGKAPQAIQGAAPKGKLGREYNATEGYQMARSACIELLATIKQTLGSLDLVAQVVDLQGSLNTEPDFEDHAQVLDGASDLLAAVFGPAGVHARSVIGVNSLRKGVPLTLKAVIEIKAGH
ncbi:RidA family protein [Paucibacter sp. AS339]|uniref:RidA family protein n=1 Tax=Paucibacter hankyongi TaxID=3133434 RepID=UPI0030B4F296